MHVGTAAKIISKILFIIETGQMTERLFDCAQEKE